MFIYMKESQILSLMYDITEIQPNLSNLTNFVYQVFFIFIKDSIHKSLSKFINIKWSIYESAFYHLYKKVHGKLSRDSIL